METLVNTLLKWLTLGPLKGHRTEILSFILFLLGGLKLTGHLPTAFDEKTFTALTTILTGAIGATAAAHKNGSP